MPTGLIRGRLPGLWGMARMLTGPQLAPPMEQAQVPRTMAKESGQAYTQGILYPQPRHPTF